MIQVKKVLPATLVVLFQLVVILSFPTNASAESENCSINTVEESLSSQVSLSPGHAQIWRLYQAFFLRQPDIDGLNYWLDVRSQGYSLSSIAYQFSASAEFINTYGNLDNGEYVDLVYNNVLCRTPDSEGRSYWINQLNSGELTRWSMVVNFTELSEYLDITNTCHSIYPEQTENLTHCSEANYSSLNQASLSSNGYESYNASYARHNGDTGSFQGVIAEINANTFKTSSERCSVASINANWLVPEEKDSLNPGVLGLGVIDGVHVKNSLDRPDRGVFGLRFDYVPSNIVEVWPGDNLSDDDIRLNSVMWSNNGTVLEHWRASSELSPYLNNIAQAEVVNPSEWLWAVAGDPLIVDGQVNPAFSTNYVNDPYTHQTLRHTFVAVDQDSAQLVFGGTSNSDSLDLVNWAQINGFEDLIKFDGGGSAEFNVNKQPIVAGTGRDIPIWFGIGC